MTTPPKPDGNDPSPTESGEHDAPPGAVSDQNQEEAPSAMRDDERHPEPRTEE